jgi:hypothetical protein
MSAETPYHLPIQFQLFVTNYAILSSVGSVFIPPHRSEELSQLGSDILQDFGGNPVAPEDVTAQQLTAAGGNSLTGFLAKAAEFQTSASFSIQSTLESIKNTFFGRRIVVPEGIGSQLNPPPIENRGTFQPAARGIPIHQMRDEYIESSGLEPQFDQAELERVRDELRLRTPEELEAEARRQLAALGIDVTRPSTNYLLLGRAAFAGLQVMGSFGMRRASGVLNPVGQLP